MMSGVRGVLVSLSLWLVALPALADVPPRPPARPEGGCGCSTAGSSGETALALGMAAVGALALMGRKKRPRERA